MSMVVLLVSMGWSLQVPTSVYAVSEVKTPTPKSHPVIQHAATQPAAIQSATTPPSSKDVLPSGHPALPGSGQKLGAKPPANAGHTYNFHANVTLQVNRPGTAGPPLKGLPVTVWLIHQNEPLREYKRQLGASASLQIKDVKLSVPVMPLVRVTYDGVDYEVRGPILNTRQPSAKIEVQVYPTTTSKPPLHVAMRHVMLRRGAQGIWVHEVITLENPTQRAWINAAKKTQNTPGTFSLKLPQDVGEIRLGKGFSSQYTRYEGGVLKLDNPVNPGTNSFEIDYAVKVVNGKCVLTLQTSESVKHLMVFVPEDLVVLKTTGFAEESEASLSEKKVNVYQSKNLPSQVVARLEIQAPTPQVAVPKQTGPKAIIPTSKGRP